MRGAGARGPSRAGGSPGLGRRRHARAALDGALTVHQALATLSSNCREILDRFFARDESYRTIGDALDLPAGTIASRISRCLVKLRTALEGRSTVRAESLVVVIT